MKPMTRRLALTLLAGVAAYGATRYYSRQQGISRARALYANPLDKPVDALNVFHLGHSLVGRDMPAMVAQLAGEGHNYHSQLGWGTSLKAHWEPDEPINGFDVENDHPAFSPAKEAISSGAYDALVLTEMVEIRDAIKYHKSSEYLARWAGLAWDANPDVRIYLYETWHNTDDDAGWLARIDSDLRAYWLGRVKYPALANTDAPIHLIPAGQVMAAFIRAVELAGPQGVGGIARVEDLFGRNEDGTPDTIHFNDLGAYLVSLTHYAVLYHTSPVGLAYELLRADGTAADAPTAEAAALMQRIVWDVVGLHPETGVAV
jgi:hypothetical protein